MARFYYQRPIEAFLIEDESFILGELAKNHEFALDEQQRNAWHEEIRLLKSWLHEITGHLVLEYSIPRMGRRVDCVVLAGAVVFVIEFKVGAHDFDRSAIDQVTDYALDLKNFHEQSHCRRIVPILICSEAANVKETVAYDSDNVAKPLLIKGNTLLHIIARESADICQESINPIAWINAVYKPTPTIIQAAQALYEGHSVEEISRSDAGAINLTRTVDAIHKIIEFSRTHQKKSICFLTGVPGAGKTLAGLNLAHSFHEPGTGEHAVFLSGNGPLVEVLREALARNEKDAAKERGESKRKSETISKAKAFIQNVHHFRDDALDSTTAPSERVVVFDEAQRAWTQKQTAAFMKKKKGKAHFGMSEPEFLIGTMDRHEGWATIVCLVGGGQEINTGEAGIREWFDALRRSFPHWEIHISSKLSDTEYTRGEPLISEQDKDRVRFNDDLHLAVSVRSFRSEKVAAFVKAALDCDVETAMACFTEIKPVYPIFLTRNVELAKDWLRSKARGSERFGLIASSRAMRLRPYGMHVGSKVDPVVWFLNEKNDVRSSFFLEEVATEFDVQGLELDWTCVAWDADLRHDSSGWTYKSFRGTRWQDVNKSEDRLFLKNAYRVLLTRARQGMVIFVPEGSSEDVTRRPEFYDSTFAFLRNLGISVLEDSECSGSGNTPTSTLEVSSYEVPVFP
jgi:hypothetical protein